FDQLNARIEQLPVINVFITEYPDPTRDDRGYPLNAILDDIAPGFKIDNNEIAWAEFLVGQLNGAVAAAASNHNWHYVGGIVDAFNTHGYGAHDRWFRTAQESRDMQGPYHNNSFWAAVGSFISTGVGYLLGGTFVGGLLGPELGLLSNPIVAGAL